MLKAWTEATYCDSKGDVLFLCHSTVMPSGIIKLGASLRFAAITDGRRGGIDGKHLGVKDVALMKLKLLV